MFYTITDYGTCWKAMEDMTEMDGSYWNMAGNCPECDGKK